jgi:hypothetical protein
MRHSPSRIASAATIARALVSDGALTFGQRRFTTVRQRVETRILDFLDDHA